MFREVFELQRFSCFLWFQRCWASEKKKPCGAHRTGTIFGTKSGADSFRTRREEFWTHVLQYFDIPCKFHACLAPKIPLQLWNPFVADFSSCSPWFVLPRTVPFFIDRKNLTKSQDLACNKATTSNETKKNALARKLPQKTSSGEMTFSLDNPRGRDRSLNFHTKIPDNFPFHSRNTNA